jgi:hypothetical protein
MRASSGFWSFMGSLVLTWPQRVTAAGEHTDQVGLALKAHSRQVRHSYAAILHPHPVGEAAERLEQARVDLIAA